MLYNISMVEIKITEAEQGQRFDRFLKKKYKNAPLSLIYKWIRTSSAVNGKKVGQSYKLQSGDLIALDINPVSADSMTRKDDHKKTRKRFKIAYEDDNLLIAEKPQGLLTHGTHSEKRDTLANQVLGYLMYKPADDKTFVPAPINRLDRNTAGLVIFGKNYQATRQISTLLREKTGINKYYLSIVSGKVSKELDLRGYLKKDDSTNTVRITKEDNGREIITTVKPLASNDNFSLVEIKITTGRSHQIRAHLAHVGFPLVGDPKYGNFKINQKLGLNMQLLHAYKLHFEIKEPPLDYLDGKTIVSSLPDNFAKLSTSLLSCNHDFFKKLT